MLLARIVSAFIWLVSECVGICFFVVFGIRRRVVFKNLEMAFGGAMPWFAKMRMGKSSVAAFVRTVLEFVFSPLIYPYAEVRFRNLETVTRVLERGKGIYVLAIHQGNWELMCHKGGSSVAKLYLALKPVGGPRIAAWVRNRREKNGVHEVMRDSPVPAWRQINERVSEGALVGFVMDQRRKKGVVSYLFAKPALTNVSLFRQWKDCKAPIFPLTIRRTGLLSHEAVFWDELEVWNEDSASEEEFYKKNAERMNAAVEEMIRWNPNEYFWLHDRWKM
jgi:KDO2-lipid IV(A) lauroyltransferase